MGKKIDYAKRVTDMFNSKVYGIDSIEWSDFGYPIKSITEPSIWIPKITVKIGLKGIKFYANAEFDGPDPWREAYIFIIKNQKQLKL